MSESVATKKAPPTGGAAPWRDAAQDVLDSLGADRQHGLSAREARRRLERHGANALRRTKSRSAASILVDQLKSALVVLLAAAAAVSLLFDQWVEAVAIAGVLVVNTVIGLVTELRAVRAMEALRELGGAEAKVRRDGAVKRIPASEVVPGDILLVEAGDRVSADVRLVAAAKLQADEASLTGESLPVGKRAEAVAAHAPLAERSDMLFKGTSVTRGSGEGVVVATGMASELGRITRLVDEAEEEITPLERRLNRLGQRLLWFTLAIVAVIAATGLATGGELYLIIETAIALAVASVPEGLPIIATITLARGMRRMARRNALVNRLSAVETLGATSALLTDKTGTLTENRMRVARIVLAEADIEVRTGDDGTEQMFQDDGERADPAGSRALRSVLEVGALCNNATFDEGSPVGEPLEVALLAVARSAGFSPHDLRQRLPEVQEVAFDPETRMMATIHRDGDAYKVAVKGAPEAVLASCTRVGDGQPLGAHEREKWLARNEALAERGLRLLAMAEKRVRVVDTEPYHELTLLGLVAMADPPRVEARAAIEAARNAGIQVVMVTGDQAATAEFIAQQVGLVSDSTSAVLGSDLARHTEGSDRAVGAPILARMDPEQKLHLIEAYQRRGFVVAMTGDGVNDAPALKKADIGVAMGLRGTEVAREAADMVLLDDAFGTIIAAVEEGRAIFDNIRKFVVYLLSCNVSEIMVVGIATAVSAPLPILPLQILFLNLVTDVFPALALGVSRGDPHILKRAPRDPKESVLARRHWLAIGGYGGVITFAVLTAFALALVWLRLDAAQAVTFSFLTLAFAQLWHVFDMRAPGSSFLRNEVTANPWIWGAIALCTGLLLAAVYAPGLNDLLRLHPPGFHGWGVILGLSLVPVTVGQIALSLAPKVDAAHTTR